MTFQSSHKSVAFASNAPDIRKIPDYMDAWAANELSFTATEEQQNDRAIGERPARESYGLASAMIAKGAASVGLTPQEYSITLPPCKSKPTSGLRSILKQTPNLPHQIHRKPLPLRAQSMADCSAALDHRSVAQRRVASSATSWSRQT